MNDKNESEPYTVRMALDDMIAAKSGLDQREVSVYDTESPDGFEGQLFSNSDDFLLWSEEIFARLGNKDWMTAVRRKLVSDIQRLEAGEDPEYTWSGFYATEKDFREGQKSSIRSIFYRD